ncbi:glucan 1,4-alpha-glucosidase [Solimonas terrae]|uniref:glucan 1,4-alpha-glucosidase n=2 Tax=Solimonas terrae TaxID=1396819 RepID=A0A6M2BPZ7_9GAMM|nr:glucan 1,4-alpha-glucosidase [Solimonas terrae]
MLRSVSATGLVKQRAGFAQTVRPVRGSIIASPVPGAYDPDPDYFFHWYRDSAVVLEALRLLFEDHTLGDEAHTHFADFVRFNRALQQLDGRVLTANPDRRAGMAADFLKFVRDDDELSQVHGAAVVAETRVNPDGSLDISKWARPQHDGPPLRALALLRWLARIAPPAAIADEAAALIRDDLAFTAAHWQQPSYDIWEEEQGLHYYTLRVSAAALDEGADWLRAGGERDLAQGFRRDAAAILQALDGFWDDALGHYRSRQLAGGARSAKALDIAVVLAAIHAAPEARAGQAHSAADAKMQASFARLEALFDAAYAINRQRPAGRGVAFGRYPGDVYYSGGAYYFSTLGAAEFCFRAAALGSEPQVWRARGDSLLEMVRAYTPASGELSEQFDQNDGHQSSARHLAWSYAAFISCVTARRQLPASAG